MKRKIKLPKKFRQFLFTFGPMLLIIGLATGTVFTVKGGINEYSSKQLVKLQEIDLPEWLTSEPKALKNLN